jgi:Sec-independent protein translocase protein TatA
LWISLVVVFALFVAWRLRRAAGTLDRILREERERPEPDDATERDDQRGEHRADQQNR